MKKAFIMLGIVLLLLIGGQAFLSYKQLQNNSSIDSAYSSLGGDFSLQGVGARSLSLANFKGKALIMYLGFTHCPDICPTAMTTLAKVLAKLSIDSPMNKNKVQALFVSVDYQRDTPEIVNDYIQYYIKDGIGASGSKKQIDDLVKKYAAYYKFNKDKDSALDYSVDHTSRFYIISKNGVLLDSVSDTQTIDYIVSKLNQALKKK